jgi:hypothetical protein
VRTTRRKKVFVYGCCGRVKENSKKKTVGKETSGHKKKKDKQTVQSRWQRKEGCGRGRAEESAQSGE